MAQKQREKSAEFVVPDGYDYGPIRTVVVIQNYKNRMGRNKFIGKN